MSKKFKVGDKVRVKPDDDHHVLTPNKVYEVLGVWDYGIRVKDDAGNITGYFNERFELEKAAPEMKNKFDEWKIWNGGKCPVSPDTLVQVQLACERRIDAEMSDVLQACHFRWDAPKEKTSREVIAYREVKQPVVKKHSLKFNVDDCEGIGYGVYNDHDSDYRAVNFYLEFDEVDGVVDWNKVKVRKS